MPTEVIRTVSTSQFPDINVRWKAVDGKTDSTVALLDSGATGLFISKRYTVWKGIEVKKLPKPVLVLNVDGTQNLDGSLTEYVVLDIDIRGHKEKAMFFVSNLGNKNMIVGQTWLKQHNPEIDWITGEISFTRCPASCPSFKETGAPLKTRAEEDKPPVDTEHFPFSQSEFEQGDRLIMVMETPEAQEINSQEHVATRLAIEASRKAQKTTLEDILRGPYTDFVDVFDKKEFDTLPPRKKWDHAIEIFPDAQLPKSRLYPLSQAEQKELDAFLEENLASGRIRPSKSPTAAPFFFIKKKDGSLRPVQDYRKLNEITIKNRYPIPLINELIEKIHKAKIFSKLDIRWGYNNVRIREGDEWKAAFLTNRGLFEPLVMFFGLCNSPSTFQTMMDEILAPLIQEGHVLVYLDDILIFTETLEQHREITKRVLEILRKNRLFLKPEKCEFEKSSVEYLGLIISHNRIAMDPVKLQGVSEWPAPKNVKEVRGFLGFTGFYRRFIRFYADLARPLNDLLRKDRPFVWGSEQANAFMKMKSTILSAPVLVFPDFDKPKMLEADSSKFASGGVLSQLMDDGKWHPIAFLSKGYTEAERNYDIYDRELLAIIRCLKAWRHLLEGSNHPINVLTDHQNLSYFKEPQKLNRRQAGWATYLSRFNFVLVHRPGKSSGKPDALSRRPDHDQGENDNKDVVLIDPELFVNAIHTDKEYIQSMFSTTPVLDEIRKAQDQDRTVLEYRAQRSSPNFPKTLSWSSDGLLLSEGKIYVPKSVRHLVLKERHDSAPAGHPGIHKTRELVTRDYHWPHMGQYISDYVNHCDWCLRTKIFPAKPVGELFPHNIPEAPWTRVSVDLIVGLPESNGYDAVMNVIDRFTKQLVSIPTTVEVTSMGVARLYRDHVWRHFGMPLEILSDRGPQFASSVMKELNRLLGIDTKLTTAYHPASNGQVERVNQEVEQYLRLFCNHRQNDWSEWLAMAEFSYNNHIQASTQHTPFYINYGRHPRMGFEAAKETKKESVNDFTTRLKEIQEEARAALKHAAEDMARFYNRHRQPVPEIKVGDKVWLDARNLRTERPSKKLDHRRFGPYEVIKKISSHVYQLRLPKTMKIHPVFHVVLLTPYKEDPIVERHPPTPPEPEVVDDVPRWEVDEIIDSRIRRRGRWSKFEYLVHWHGYPMEERSWEPAETITEDVPDLVREFHQKHPSAPRKISNIEALKFQPLENFTDGDPNQKSVFPWEMGLVRRDVAL